MPAALHRHRFLRDPFAVLLALAALFVTVAPAAAQFTLPSQFLDEPVISGLSSPVGMAFLPDGRLLIVEQKTVRVRLVINGVIAPTDPLVTVPNVETAGNEQGLLGIAVDPGWPTRPYIYLHYDQSVSGKVWISRYTVGGDLANTGNGDLSINAATRYDIITDMPDAANNHNGGTLRFGPDGKLYDSIGDDANSCAAQDLTILGGKILRLNVSGLPAGGGGPPAKSLITPADNPYVGNANANAKLVAFFGLRNPFRFNIDRTNGDLVIGDVGENTIEEVDFLPTLGKNLEWPDFEGNNPGFTCPGEDQSQFTGPIYTYTHSLGRSVIGGVIYRAPVGATSPFPAAYEGDIFFSDFYASFVRRLKNNAGNWSLAPAPGQPNANDFGSGATFVSDYAIGPDGSIYYCGLVGGFIRRIRYSDTTSAPPPVSTNGIQFRAPYPSPASGQVSFDFQLPSDARVTVGVFDLTGRLVRSLDGGTQAAGLRGLTWDLVDENGEIVPAGVYMARLTVAGQHFERRFLVAR